MKVYRLEDSIGGWFIGDFDKAAYRTNKFEVAYKEHSAGEKWDRHYHTKVTEINLLTEGEIVMQGVHLTEGDIFILSPYEIADPEFLTDCKVVVIKYPGIVNDKIVV